MARVIKTVTENYTIVDADDGGVIVGNSTDPIAITMPSAIGRATFSVDFINAGTGAMSIVGQTINQNEGVSVVNSNNIWIYSLGGSGASISSLSEIPDVAIVSPTEGQVLAYAFGEWSNQDLPESGGLNILRGEAVFYVGGRQHVGQASCSGHFLTGVGTNFLTDFEGETHLFYIETTLTIESIISDTEIKLYESLVFPFNIEVYKFVEGDDAHDGKTSETAFASIERALEVIEEYDLVLCGVAIIISGIEIVNLNIDTNMFYGCHSINIRLERVNISSDLSVSGEAFCPLHISAWLNPLNSSAENIIADGIFLDSYSPTYLSDISTKLITSIRGSSYLYNCVVDNEENDFAVASYDASTLYLNLVNIQSAYGGIYAGYGGTIIKIDDVTVDAVGDAQISEFGGLIR